LGAQYKGIKKNLLRVGYTYNTNLIKPELAFSQLATAVIQNAYQFGFDMKFLKTHFKCSISQCKQVSGTEGPIYNPMLAGQTNPLGRIRIEVSYKMDTSMVMLGLHKI
jgi:long-chain fatty acid transport protein